MEGFWLGGGVEGSRDSGFGTREGGLFQGRLVWDS